MNNTLIHYYKTYNKTAKWKNNNRKNSYTLLFIADSGEPDGRGVGVGVVPPPPLGQGGVAAAVEGEEAEGGVGNRGGRPGRQGKINKFGDL